MRVAILGQPHWTAHLARMLAKHASSEVVVIPFPGATARSLLLPGAPSPDVLLRVGYRPGAATVRGVGFDVLWSSIRALHRRAAAVYYWLGTDVINALDDVEHHRARRPFRTALADTHLATAPWHVPELASIGVDARFTPLPYQLPTGALAPLPDQFSVLTYLPRGRFAFYGGEQVFAAARRFADTRFRVLGAPLAASIAPPNVEYPGWVESTDPLFRASTVVLRLAKHDGIGGTVLEGLAHGRHVIYTYPLPHVRQVQFGDDAHLMSALGDLRASHLAGILAPNLDGRAFVLEEFDEARLTRTLASGLVAVALRAGTAT